MLSFWQKRKLIPIDDCLCLLLNRYPSELIVLFFYRIHTRWAPKVYFTTIISSIQVRRMTCKYSLHKIYNLFHTSNFLFFLLKILVNNLHCLKMLFCFYIGNHPFLIIAKHSFTHLFNIIIPFYLTLLLSLVLRCKDMVKGNEENQNNGKKWRLCPFIW